MRRWLMLLTVLLALCPWALCEDRMSVVCTDFPCYDFARQVAGESAQVTMLLRPGGEAHAFDPTPADMLSIGESDLFVYIGGESDAWVEGILASLDGVNALRMMDAVEPLPEEDGDAEAPEYDEHIWLSPTNAVKMVGAVAEALCSADPAHAEAYGANAERYCDQIKAIDAEIRGLVAGARRRELVFADRFPFIYFTREYGLDHLAAFASCTADTEPSAQTLMMLIDRVAEDHLPAVYTIEMSTQAIARTVAEETGAQILTLHSMQTVTQEEFEAGESWVSLMKRNVAALGKGLN